MGEITLVLTVSLSTSSSDTLSCFCSRSFHPYSFLHYTFPFPQSFSTFHQFKFRHFTFFSLSITILFHFPFEVYFSCHWNMFSCVCTVRVWMWPVWACAPCRCPGSKGQRGWPGSLQRCPGERCPPSACGDSWRPLPSPWPRHTSELKCTVRVIEESACTVHYTARI